MLLYLTKKLAEKLKLTPAQQTAEDEFYSCRANYVQEYGFRFIVFMNDATHFTVVINEVKVAKLKKLPELFTQTLRETLLAFSVNPEVADRYIAELGEFTYSKNSDRKKIAQLNKSAEMAWWTLRDYTHDTDLSICASSATHFAGDEIYYPKDKMIELLGKYSLPVRKCCVFDLNVRLDLDGNDAVRKLRVPATIVF